MRVLLKSLTSSLSWTTILSFWFSKEKSRIPFSFKVWTLSMLGPLIGARKNGSKFSSLSSLSAYKTFERYFFDFEFFLGFPESCSWRSETIFVIFETFGVDQSHYQMTCSNHLIRPFDHHLPRFNPSGSGRHFEYLYTKFWAGPFRSRVQQSVALSWSALPHIDG